MGKVAGAHVWLRGPRPRPKSIAKACFDLMRCPACSTSKKLSLTRVLGTVTLNSRPSDPTFFGRGIPPRNTLAPGRGLLRLKVISSPGFAFLGKKSKLNSAVVPFKPNRDAMFSQFCLTSNRTTPTIMLATILPIQLRMGANSLDPFSINVLTFF